jgi:hypothetical protein
MSIFLFAIVLVKETDEIVDTLSPMEIKQINELPEGDRQYAMLCLKNGTLPNRSNWNDLQTREMFFAPEAIHVDQVVDKSNFIGSTMKVALLGSKIAEAIAQSTNSRIDSVWVEGVGTSNLSDGDDLKTQTGMYVCVGNKKYRTAIGGSRSVMHVVRVRPEGSLKVLRAIAQPRGYRVWGEGGGGQLLLAKLLRSSRTSITIQPLGRKRMVIKTKNLTPVDAKWVEEQKKAK